MHLKQAICENFSFGSVCIFNWRETELLMSGRSSGSSMQKLKIGDLVTDMTRTVCTLSKLRGNFTLNGNQSYCESGVRVISTNFAFGNFNNYA